MTSSKNHLLFLCDFETSGLDPQSDAKPIELAGLFLDRDFQVVDKFETLINWGYERWMTEEQIASYNVHKIEAESLLTAPSADDVAFVLKEKILRLKNEHQVDRVIIASDNAQFEYRFMEFLFRFTRRKFPFHYCAWDTSILLEGLFPDIRDPVVPHRAMADVEEIYRHLTMAVNRVKGIEQK